MSVGTGATCPIMRFHPALTAQAAATVAGSLAILLIGVYYSAQILFFGAEFTQVYANRYSSRIVPDPDMVKLSELERAKKGIPHQEKLEKANR